MFSIPEQRGNIKKVFYTQTFSVRLWYACMREVFKAVQVLYLAKDKTCPNSHSLNLGNFMMEAKELQPFC